MRVICIGNTKRLVKGAIYDVMRLDNLDTSKGKSYFRPRILIKLNETLSGGFNIKNFKLEDGSPIPEMNWESSEWQSKSIDWNHGRIKEDNIKKGDYVIYTRNSHKSLVQGKKYKVDDINIVKHKTNWGGTSHTSWVEVEIKIEGSSRFYKTYSFRKCTPQEARDIALNVLFDEETGVEKVDKNIRKIDKYESSVKEQILIKVLLSAALDSNRNNMSIVQWAISKTAPQYSLQESDFTSLLNNPLITILNKMN